MQRRTVDEIRQRREAGNRMRKIAAYIFSGASVPGAIFLYLNGASASEQIVVGLVCFAVAELLDINIALRGGE